MFDLILVNDMLTQVKIALLRIERRFKGINTHTDFYLNDENHDKLDAIAMLLIAIGESFKKIDKITNKKLLIIYPEIDWKGLMGARDVLAHDYFDINSEQVFNICLEDIPFLLQIVDKMIIEINRSLV